MKQLFGTDGIRGVAGDFPLDEATVHKIGSSLTRQFSETLGRIPRFITGRDTRESGEWIERAFHAGASASLCESAGVITTPGVAYVTRAFDFDAGVVISASHNPFQDNGIKIFLPSGQKIDGKIERSIEADIESDGPVSVLDGKVHEERAEEFRAAYLEHIRNSADGFSAAGKKIVIDCANGAASGLAKKLFSSVGAEVVVVNDNPNGRNINDRSGSTHIDLLPPKVLAERADLGIAFDGDADRALFVDEKGQVVDGDATLWIMARYLKEHGGLKNSTVVATVMSNLGLEHALAGKDITLLRADVGDKYVLQKLLDTGSEVGGEQSGHIIFPKVSLVGDGMMTALLLVRAIAKRNVTLSDACRGLVRYPQILKNVRVNQKLPFVDVPVISAAAAAIESELKGEGRLLLRYSGTENLARVMIEGKDQSVIEDQAFRLTSVIEDALG